MSFRAIPVCLLALVLAGCGGAAPAASKPAAPAGVQASTSAAPSGLTKLNVGFGQLIAQYWPLWIAQDTGIYTANGLDVSQQNIAASAVMAALLSGEVNVVVTGGTELLTAIANGGDMVTVANLAPIITQKLEVSPKIQKKEDLVGKKFGISRFGSTTDTNTRELLQRIGLNPDKDVTYVQLETAAAMLAGLTAGSVDASLMSPPQTLTAEAAGFHPMYELADFKLPATGQIVVMPRAYITAHRPVAQKFVDSLMQGLTRIRQDKPAAIASLSKWMKLQDQARLNLTYDYFTSTVFPAVPYATPDQFAKEIARVSQATGKLQNFDMSSVIDSSLVKDAVDRGLAKP